MRLVYLGTPESAVPPLQALHGAGHDIALVVTRPDKRRGRGGHLSPSPVKQAALDLGLTVSHDVDDVLALEPPAELGVVVAFGRIIRPHVLVELPMVNLHFSLLPRWRGAAPVERAILAGDDETGVGLMEVEEGLDTGGVYREVRVPIGADETADELRARLVAIGTDLLVDTLDEPLGSPTPQAGEPVYAEKIDPAELEIDWRQPAEVVHRIVRVGNAFTAHRGRRVKVWQTALLPPGDAGPPEAIVVGTGTDPIAVLEVQPEGKGRMAAADWARGARWQPGDHFDEKG